MKQLIYFIRHGETDFNVEKRWQGGEIDTELNDNGIDQSKKSGIYLNNYQQKEIKFDMIIASPLKRAQKTAEIIATNLNFPVENIIYDDDLKEKFLGDTGGKNFSEVKQSAQFELYNKLNDEWTKIVDPIERALKKDEFDEISYKLHRIETPALFKQRCKRIIDKIISSDKQKILVVAHGGVISATLKLLFGLFWDLPHGKLIGEGNCKIMLVEYENGKFLLRSAPNNEHLEFIHL